MTIQQPRPTNSVVRALRSTSQNLIDQGVIRDREVITGHLVVAAVAMVPSANGGGISRTQERDVRSSHATSQAIYELDQLQDRLGEGPCIKAADHPPPDGIVLIRDLGGPEGEQFPHFAERAVSAGFRSMLSASITGLGSRHRSALNLYSETTDAFSDDDQTVTGLFASHAGALLYGADEAEGLNNALRSRDVIGQAKGVLMERFTLTDDEAFHMLVESSQDTNLKLVDVARWVTHEVERRRGDPSATARTEP